VLERLGSGTSTGFGAPKNYKEVEIIDDWARREAGKACREVETR
jgi:hypothetical protein